MGKVVALRVLKRQLDMLQVGVIRHGHRQPCAGKVALIVKAQIVFDDGRLRAALQRQMVAIVGGVHFIACQPTRQVHNQQRFIRVLVAPDPNMGNGGRQAFGQMQKDFGLNGVRQLLTLVIHLHFIAAGGQIVTQARAKLTVDKHQPPCLYR